MIRKLLALWTLLAGCLCAADAIGRLAENHCTFAARLWQCRGNEMLGSARVPFENGVRQQQGQARGNTWKFSYSSTPVKDRSDSIDLRVRFKLVEGSAEETAVSVDLEFDEWAASNYVLLPGAVYNGNRFRARRTAYPPLLPPEDRRPDLPITINDVPRLEMGPGDSRIEESTGDLATPAIGFYSPRTHSAFWLLTEQRCRLGNLGLFVEESEDRQRAVIRVIAPAVRELRPSINGRVPSADRGAKWNQGDELTLHLRLAFFDAPKLQALFDRFADIRKDLSSAPGSRQDRPAPAPHVLPFSQAWEILEDKFNRQNWNEAAGLYGLGGDANSGNMNSIWQLGWVGGGQSTQALLFCGKELSRLRARRTLETVLTRSQARSGFFYTLGDGQHWYSDGFTQPFADHLMLIRKNADALYFFLKQFALLKQQGQSVPRTWEDAVRRQADAFVQLWKRYGQFGQFVNIETGEIVIGATTSAAIVPAALALASRYYDAPAYMEVAKAAARLFYKRDVIAGVTTGGPSEALQSPDYESAYHLVESFAVLHELTGEQEWLNAAEEMARQFSTWIVSYDYEFPSDSTFAKLAMRTTGAGWANAQNRHAAPALCTASGDALLRLFRATGNRFYLELLRDIAHGIPQYMSRADRPVPAWAAGKLCDQAPGWICERIQMSDWETPAVPVGEIYPGSSSWAETALMLTWIEVPGLYVQPDRGLAFAIDHIDSRIVAQKGNEVTVLLSNPTKFPARVRTLVESMAAAREPLGFNSLLNQPVIEMEPGEQKSVVFDAEKGLAERNGRP